MPDGMFPLAFPVHIGFCAISLLFFLFLYVKTGYKYHLLTAVAIPSSMLIYFCTTKPIFYTFGLVQFGLVIAIFVLMHFEKPKEVSENENGESDENAENFTDNLLNAEAEGNDN
jgi:predicted membrane protein